jgi:hypothetical protein
VPRIIAGGGTVEEHEEFFAEEAGKYDFFASCALPGRRERLISNTLTIAVAPFPTLKAAAAAPLAPGSTAVWDAAKPPQPIPLGGDIFRGENDAFQILGLAPNLGRRDSEPLGFLEGDLQPEP